MRHLAAIWRWKWLIGAGTVLGVVATLWWPGGSRETFNASRWIDLGAQLPANNQTIIALLAALEPEDRGGVSARFGGLRVQVTGHSEAATRATLEQLTAAMQPELDLFIERERERVEAAVGRRIELESRLDEFQQLQLDLLRRDRSPSTVMLFTSMQEEILRLEERLGALGPRSRAPAPSLRFGEVHVSRVAGENSPFLLTAVAGLVVFLMLSGLAVLVEQARPGPAAAPDVPATGRAT